ncbi:hypothetical protein QBC47DRAFT_429327 [Echria macrotheca]|uniref:DUF3492 domain-containing protein n=1 Tax=Echria macrotheca TaxID=438768 RepID=A0AAJ0FA68_9PEZI|nr:hypothetical protein QBC47DRAFT_429327 [Echria macrotheca]
MASFFQPLHSSGDPVINVCNSRNASDAAPTRRLVYCNEILSLTQRLQTPLQQFLLALSLACLVLPLTVWLGESCFKQRRKTHRKGEENARRRPTKSDILGPTTAPSSSLLTETRSFHFVVGNDDAGIRTAGDRTLYIVPLPSFKDPDGERHPMLLAQNNTRRPFGLLNSHVVFNSSIPVWSNFLFNLFHREGVISGVILRLVDVGEIDEEAVARCMALVSKLGDIGIPTVVNCDQDDHGVLDGFDFDALAGVILDNACIMKDGQRRDFFRSRRLRDIMSKCVGERARRPHFFVGFHDRWNTRPAASVVCRAAKVSRHFDAVLVHGPTNECNNGNGADVSEESRSVRGNWQLQQILLNQKRGVHLGHSLQEGTDVTCLDLDKLSMLIPKVRDWLQPFPVSTEKCASEPETLIEPPSYVELAPPRVDIWESSPDGGRISPLGCLPFTVWATQPQHDQVLATQVRLRDLNLLHRLNDVEVTEIIDRLKLILPGLTEHHVTVYRGLGTGFTMPETNVEFWGLSCPSNSVVGVDIFLSRRSPCDTATVTHTWLAHHGVSRIHRYEEELRFESSGTGDTSTALPVSIRTAIDLSTPFENLPRHRFRKTIEDYCRKSLIYDVSVKSWNDMHCRQFLGNMISLSSLFDRRLNDFANLALHMAVEQLVGDCLFSGSTDPLNAIVELLSNAFGCFLSEDEQHLVDINTEFFATMFFCVMRQAALEDVYLESTDRCPVFSHPDQAAVFAELWVLGSQCELYFGTTPRALGQILYDKHRALLLRYPPVVVHESEDSEIMSVYVKLKPAQGPPAESPSNIGAGVPALWNTLTELGALSVFCLPAMLDIILLSFVGRGLFMTAYMGNVYLNAACYALLLSLLLSAGITGWVGSIGNYYLAHYAYGNMVHFHVQRLSGAFVLSIIVGITGALLFYFKLSLGAALTFFAYFMFISTYLCLLGILSTMYQPMSPFTSGRTVLWRTIPLLFLSPVISSFFNNYDLIIYLSVEYGFLSLLLLQYRGLCREWTSWTDKIPKFGATDINQWYTARVYKGPVPDDTTESSVRIDRDETQDLSAHAAKVFRQHLEVGHLSTRLRSPAFGSGGLVERVVAGLPYIDWLLAREESTETPERFSAAWFGQLSQALKSHQQMVKGLKEHSIFMLFRYAGLDIAQNIGLFLICLMDRWVSITMSSTSAQIDIFSSFTSRYAICFAILYFCTSIMILDVTLKDHWKSAYDLPEARISSNEAAKTSIRQWKRARRKEYFGALMTLFRRMIFVFGCFALFVWLLVDDKTMIWTYFLYSWGYTAIVLFQFNRCFTPEHTLHVTSVIVSAAIGFGAGCLLHIFPKGKPTVFTDVTALCISGSIAAILTTICVFGDAGDTLAGESSPSKSMVGLVSIQHRLGKNPRPLPNVPQHGISGDTITPASGDLYHLVDESLSNSHRNAGVPAWAIETIELALALWREKRVLVSASSYSKFRDCGLEDIISFSHTQGDRLYITTGVMRDFDSDIQSWQALAAKLIAESVVYHVGVAKRSLSPDLGAYASLLVHGDDLSWRVELELTLRAEHSAYSALDTTANLVQHLCLGIDVDLVWDDLPFVVRTLIVDRIMGRPTRQNRKVEDWLRAHAKDLNSSDYHVWLQLRLYQASTSRLERRRTDPETDRCLRETRSIQFADFKSTPLDWLSCFDPTKFLVHLTRWIGLISGGSSAVERELCYHFRGHSKIQFVTIRMLMGLWRICKRMKDAWVYAILIYHHRALVHISRLAQKGTSRSLSKNRISIQLRRKTMTGFAGKALDGLLLLEVFDGSHRSIPQETNPVASAHYDEKFRLARRCDEGRHGRSMSTYTYAANSRSRRPVKRDMLCAETQSTSYYDKHGRITHGVLTFTDTAYSFRYRYKQGSKQSAEVLKADFVESGSHRSLQVCWGAPSTEEAPDDLNWVPSDRVYRVTRTMGDRRYTTKFDYRHRRDPTLITTLEEDGRSGVIPWPPPLFDHEDQLLRRPQDNLFENEDLFIHHRRRHVELIASFSGKVFSWRMLANPKAWQYWRTKTSYRPVPTWWLRTELWSHWRDANDLDAIAACWVDEMILRQEPLLANYWRLRGSGDLTGAKVALDSRIDQIAAIIELEKEISEVCLLPIKTSDLYAMGLSRDANQITTRPQDCFDDGEDRISVIFNDIGCWPDAPGGVSNCRRDLVNGHRTIRNHVLAESANEFGIPRFQIERNVQSLKLLPLWGLDGRTANHGLIDNLLESQVDAKMADTDEKRDIVEVFIPLLKLFVKGARSRSISKQDMDVYSTAVFDMFEFFQHKDYNKTWNSRSVAAAWVEAWLTQYDDPNIVNPTDYFEIQRPSLKDFRTALSIYSSYFFIFSVQTPTDCPRVFQSTHHGISSLFGVFLKHKRGVNFGIWDHAILWRECCLNLSPAQSTLPLAVQSMILSGIGLAMRLAYFHADVVLPCTSVFNPIWETELGADGGRLEHRKAFRRKIDPIVNGVSNMDAFQPVERVRTDKPTVVMLSNVQFIKDIKTAIMAADVIVNKYGFKDYQLFVYGARDREPGYDIDMTRLIESCNLAGHVVLKGFGKPQEALQDAWLFMNSSLSEGLPLAIAEAALAGVPIVATAVGATALVLTDPENPSVRYGEVVPPNDPTALARAQIAILAMAGPWAKYCGEVDARGSVLPHLVMPDNLSPSDVEWLARRMQEKAEDRRQLGMLGRQLVLRGFHGKRYLREHEQMYWVQWRLAQIRRSPKPRHGM